MILETVQIDIKEGMESEFEAGVKKAVPFFQRSKGCRSLELQRSVEKPRRYRLFVQWDTVENHTVDFKESGNWQEWRSCVAHCFADAPHMEHNTLVLKGF